MGRAISLGDQADVLCVRAEGLGALQRTAACDQPELGALLPAGNHLGGDGRVNFALPDLRGRTPIHVGSGHTLGERGGEQAHTLSLAELPQHVHQLQASSVNASQPSGTNAVLSGALNAYGVRPA